MWLLPGSVICTGGRIPGRAMSGWRTRRSNSGEANREAGDTRRLYYPIEIVRALVGVWLFAGCRIDEIRRLEVDCIERDEGRDEQTGETFPIEQ
jgi:hypothetical protein